ncbi:MAG TPA: nucleotide sugar dehydrogenase [Armatimonadetes bacterium]|nr:nucleotide sugar dehydrogenase [Armatimonadota bacterium]
MSLEEKFADRTAKVAIMGLGYAGLPVAVAFAQAGLRTVGLDPDERRVAALNAGQSYIKDVSPEEVRDLVERHLLRASRDFSNLAHVDAILICVPTPLTPNREPDLQYIQAATEQVARFLLPGQLVVLESTTYPGTTEEVLLPQFEARGLTVGRDFFLAFSPERVDPGSQWRLRNTPKVVGGITERCREAAVALYRCVCDQVVPVSSTRVAELTKLLENIFRNVNIALVNELALLCHRMGIDVWEVIEASATKPFGFMKFTPGPGVGGHCVPADPFYLSWKANQYDFRTRFIELAGEVNWNMPYYVVQRISEVLNREGKCLNGSRLLLLGAAYKSNIDDTRESPFYKVAELLRQAGAEILYHDPYVSEVKVGEEHYTSVPLTPETLSEVDGVVLVTDHDAYDHAFIVEHAPWILDTRNAFRDFKAAHIFKM